MKKSLIALAFGTLALGMTEFVMMGILADVANALGITIPQAGHLVSAYALGVTCGAPLLAVAKQFRPKSILLFLVCLIFIGALISSVAQSYEMLLVARFISGLPHGAYFGVASIVAVRLADEGHKTGAVSTMIAGMTMANLLGVPLETALSAHISWRMPFIIISFYSLLVIYYIWKWVPQLEVTPSNGYKGQFRFLKTGAPWLILGATMLGNGGVFCFYSPDTDQRRRHTIRIYVGDNDSRRFRHGGGQSRQRKAQRPLHSGQGGHGDDAVCRHITDVGIHLRPQWLGGSSVHRVLGAQHVRHEQSAAVSHPQTRSRRRDARRRLHTDGVQYGKRRRGFPWRTAYSGRSRRQVCGDCGSSDGSWCGCTDDGVLCKV